MCFNTRRASTRDYTVLGMKNLQEQVKKAFCYQKLFWPFTVWINCSSDLKNFANSRPSASNFKSFSRSLEQFFLTVGQNNFGNKIPFFIVKRCKIKLVFTCQVLLFSCGRSGTGSSGLIFSAIGKLVYGSSTVRVMM